MDVKRCLRCGETKPLSEFYKCASMADGYFNKCKKCYCSDVRANRRERQEYYAEYDRKRGNRQPIGYLKGYRQKNPDKYKAQTALGNAVRDGKVSKEPCFMCGSDENIHGHHPDYGKPLEVIWLCSMCHRRLHAYQDRVASIMSSEVRRNE